MTAQKVLLVVERGVGVFTTCLIITYNIVSPTRKEGKSCVALIIGITVVVIAAVMVRVVGVTTASGVDVSAKPLEEALEEA